MNSSQTRHTGAWAIILAAGASSRLGGACPKQFIEWKGRPLYWQSVEKFARCPFVRGLVLVFAPEYCAREELRMKEMVAESDPGMPWLIAAGGKSRAASAANGLRLVPVDCPTVFVHDAARPFFTPGLANRLHDALGQGMAGVIPAIQPVDTIKIANGGFISDTLPRQQLCAVQTPQLFWADILRKANEVALRNGWQATDDASLVEKLGGKVRVVEGEEGNVKITKAADLALLADNSQMWLPCNGFGYDAHRFGPGRPLRLGGVAIPGGMELIAHSDGDVLLHALIDALFGAASLGDIGKHFPPSDPALEGISSAVMLDHCLDLFRDRGLILCQVDLTIVAQKPRLEPWKGEIARNVARLLGLDASRVGLKATTEEGMGFTGKMEGIKAYALASALRKGGMPCGL